MGETTKCDVLHNGCERHGYVGCTECTADELRALRARLSAAERERDAAFARGVEAAALAMALIAETPADAERYAVHIRDTCLALSPAPDAGKEPTEAKWGVFDTWRRRWCPRYGTEEEMGAHAVRLNRSDERGAALVSPTYRYQPLPLPTEEPT